MIEWGLADDKWELDQIMTWRQAVTLTLKHRETHGCIVSTVPTDALVLKHQAINIHNAHKTFIVLDRFHIKNVALTVNNIRK